MGETGRRLRVGTVAAMEAIRSIRIDLVMLGLGEGGDRSAVNRAASIGVAGLPVGVSSWAEAW